MWHYYCNIILNYIFLDRFVGVGFYDVALTVVFSGSVWACLMMCCNDILVCDM